MQKFLVLFLMLLSVNAAADSWYGKAFGGVNFLQPEKILEVHYNYNAGFAATGAVGYRFCNGLEFEGEYAFRRNTIDKLWFIHQSYPMPGHFHASAFMANLIWNIDPSEGFLWGIQPLIGGGIGYTRQRLCLSKGDISFSRRKQGVAWQLIGGFGYTICGTTRLSLEYRFHRGPMHTIYNHAFGVGFTYYFTTP